MDSDISVTTRYEGTVTVVLVEGELDVATAPELRTRLVEIIAEGETELILDFTDVTFLDSTALGVLISARRRVQALDGFVDVVTSKPHLLKLFHITALDKVFALHPTVKAALAAH